jgi:hypothetical protein
MTRKGTLRKLPTRTRARAFTTTSSQGLSHLTGITDERGIRYATFGYTTAGLPRRRSMPAPKTAQVTGTSHSQLSIH